MITALDHIAIVVADLDAAVANYERFLGRKANWRGHYLGADHAWLQLPNVALNLLSPTGPGQIGDEVRSRLEAAGEGLWAVAFTVADLDLYVSEATRRGVKVGAPTVLNSTQADGATRTWRLCDADITTTAGVEIVLVDRPRASWPTSEPLVSEASAVSALDHVVINTPNPDRAVALYGARLGLDFRLERSNPAWGSKLMFFRCGGTVVEIVAALNGALSPDAPDHLSGLAWRVSDPHAAQARLVEAGLDVSEVRTGRKPGTRVFTIRSGVPGAPTLMLSTDPISTQDERETV